MVLLPETTSNKAEVNLKRSVSPAAGDHKGGAAEPLVALPRVQHIRFKSPNHLRPSQASLPARLRGKCLRSLAGGHFAATCK